MSNHSTLYPFRKFGPKVPGGSKPTAIFGPKVSGGSKPTGFLHGDDNISMSEYSTGDQKPADDHKRNEKTSMVKLLTTTLLPLIVSVFLLVRFFLPSSPEFVLTDATIHAFNFSMQHSLLSSQMQVTLSSRNPNKRFGLAYENLHVYAAYKSQQITFSTLLPAAYLKGKDTDVWSPYLSGFDVPVAPFFGEELDKDDNDGFVFLSVMVDGRVRYNLWFFNFGSRLSVNCPAYFSSPRGVLPATAGVVRFQQTSTCNVDA